MRALVLAALALAVAPAYAQPPAADSKVRFVRSVSGTRGATRAGHFEVEDPRTVFTLPQDRQVLVYFEWEGAPGTHHYEGRWKDPTGAVVLVAPADQPASGRRLAIYWTLALPPNAAPGLWALEASVDGVPAGTHTFEIKGGAASRAPLPAAQLYERARNAAAAVERLGPAGETTGVGLATALDDATVVVPFPIIDGASSVRVVLADGRRLTAEEVGGWSRADGWAVLRAAGHGLPVLPRAASRPAVGDPVFVLDEREDGSRVLGQTSVIGEKKAGGGRSHLLLADGAAAGALVLNGEGAQVGTIVLPGDVQLGEAGSSFALAPRAARGTVLLDAGSVAPGASFSTLAQLAAQGHFMRPLSPLRRHVISGVFAARVERGGAVPMPRDQRASFARNEGHAFVFVQWNPQDKYEGSSIYEVFDGDNKRVAASDANRLKLKPRELLFSSWGVPIARLPAAAYRVDLLLDGEPVWRGWLRVTD
jgi:hypothetical protein